MFKQTDKGEWFYINKNNEWILRKGPKSGVSISSLYKISNELGMEDNFFDLLDDIFDNANWIDKKNIWTIKKEIRVGKRY